MITLKLTEPELDMIYELLKSREREGSYYGNRAQYYSRLNKVINKIEKLNHENAQ